MHREVKQWFQHLPEPIRSKALAEVYGIDQRNKKRSLLDALDAFDWDDSKDGFEYWESVCHDQEDGKLHLRHEVVMYTNGTAHEQIEGKTAWDWYRELPEPIRSKAIIDSQPSLDLYPSLIHALRNGFKFGKSTFGFEYWESVCADQEDGILDLRSEVVALCNGTSKWMVDTNNFAPKDELEPTKSDNKNDGKLDLTLVLVDMPNFVKGVAEVRDLNTYTDISKKDEDHKYSRLNYLLSIDDIEDSKSFRAKNLQSLARHMQDLFEGKTHDDKSGLPLAYHIACRAGFEGEYLLAETKRSEAK